MDLDLALREDQPASLMENSTHDEKRLYEKWDRSNRMSLIIIKRSILEAFRGAVSEGTTEAKDFFTEIEKRFLKYDKAETNTLLQSLFSMSYNYQKDKWSLNELISYYVQEEERLKQEKTKSANLASTSKDKGMNIKYKSGKNKADKGPIQKR
uniref:Uncharacterized protein n=1 Tax=Musa acuminata subsp. malaccensis TaxID=214687 RepID=A0A804J594_MUSAM